MSALSAAIRITRPDSTLLALTTVTVAHYARTQDLGWSLSQGLPLVFTCIATFIANDLEDVERDAVNNPDRPLPSGQLSQGVATLGYFACLAAALSLTKDLIDPRIAFWYYGLIAVSVSYGHLVRAFPAMKGLYVASTVAALVLMVSSSYPSEARLIYVAGAAFIGTLGRELCKDVRDRAGDSPSVLKRISAGTMAAVGLGLQFVGVAMLTRTVDRPTHIVAVGLMLIALTLAAFLWFSQKQIRASLIAMKSAFVAALAFLV